MRVIRPIEGNTQCIPPLEAYSNGYPGPIKGCRAKTLAPIFSEHILGILGVIKQTSQQIGPLNYRHNIGKRVINSAVGNLL